MLHPIDERDRIPVAAPRPRPPRPAQVAAGPRAADAGLTMIIVIAAFAAGGFWAGGKLGAAIAGGILGILIGIVAGFTATYTHYRDL